MKRLIRACIRSQSKQSSCRAAKYKAPPIGKSKFILLGQISLVKSRNRRSSWHPQRHCKLVPWLHSSFKVTKLSWIEMRLKLKSDTRRMPSMKQRLQLPKNLEWRKPQSRRTSRSGISQHRHRVGISRMLQSRISTSRSDSLWLSIKIKIK